MNSRVRSCSLTMTHWPKTDTGGQVKTSTKVLSRVEKSSDLIVLFFEAGSGKIFHLE